jgi:hypothetical protein
VLIGVAGAGVSRAADPGLTCLAARHKARGSYTNCLDGALARAAVQALNWETRAGKCVTKYQANWPKLQAKYGGTGTACDQPRFTANGDGTITDHLTNLQWEQKDGADGVPDAGNPHDVDNGYPWSAVGIAANGPLFSTFLAGLNGACFAGQCDWRLPHFAELQTILAEGFPCGSDPCIDPIFGPTNNFVWSSTEGPFRDGAPWMLSFGSSAGRPVFGDKMSGFAARAVRGGL